MARGKEEEKKKKRKRKYVVVLIKAETIKVRSWFRPLK